jgi:hypothetical protein
MAISFCPRGSDLNRAIHMAMRQLSSIMSVAPPVAVKMRMFVAEAASFGSSQKWQAGSLPYETILDVEAIARAIPGN